MSDNGLVWEEPPFTHNRQKSRWLSVLDDLAKRPGEWAVVHEQASDETSTQARNKKTALAMAARNGIKLDLVSRTVDRRIKLYARVMP